MATYKEIHGVNIQYRDSDAPEIEGDVWYNASTGKLRVYATAGAWATGGTGNTARQELGGDGPQSATFAVSGKVSAVNTENEHYDGSSWSEEADINVGRDGISAVGTQTASLAMGGYTTTAASEEFDGSSWTEGNDLNTARFGAGDAGTQTAGFIYGGTPNVVVIAETYNGTSWSETADLNTGRYYLSGCGTTTAALATAGTPPGSLDVNESFDGTSWTEVNDLNTGRTNIAAQFGISTAAIIAGGTGPPIITNTESWDGTSWTEVSDLLTANRLFMGGGSATSGIAAFGSIPAATGITQEWSFVASVETVAFD